MTITVYNEAGEVVTDPQEQARRLRSEFGGDWIVVYDESGKPAGVAVRDGYDPLDALNAMPPEVRDKIVEGSIRAEKIHVEELPAWARVIEVEDISEVPPTMFQRVRVKR
ncbi:hypothetical protein ACWIGM_08720 [Bosea sp. NPDC055332]